MKGLKIISVAGLFAVSIAFFGTKETPEDVEAFNVSSTISEAEEYIEAYQTTNSCEIEAYVNEVHFVDER